MAIPSPKIEITKTDTVNKLIYYKITYGSDVKFDANETNYYDYLSKIGQQGEPFVGYTYSSGNKTEGSESYQTEYDNYETSKTITVQYQYFKIYLTESFKWVNYGSGSYSTEKEAQTVMNSLPGRPQYYQVIKGNDGKYYVQQKTERKYGDQQDSFPTNGSVSITATFDKKPTELPDFSCSVIAYTNSAKASVSGIKAGDKVSFTINGTTESINSSGSSIDITINGLAEGTKYNWSVSVEGYKGPKTGDVTTLTTPKWSISSYTATSVTVQFSGVSSGTLRTVEVYYAEGHANQGSSAGSDSSTTTSTITIYNLQSGVKYFVKAKVGNEYIGGIEYFTTSVVLTPSGAIDVDYNNKIVKFNVSNLNVGQYVIAYTRVEPSDGETLWNSRYDRTTSSDPHSKYPFATWSGANYNQLYAASIYLYNSSSDYSQLAYTTFKFEKPAELEPDYDIENITDTSAEIKVINLKANDSIRITLYNASAPVETKTATVQEGFSTMGFVFRDLEPNTYYTVSVQVNGKPLTSDGFTTNGSSGTDISYTLTNITTNSVTVNISGALPAQNVAVSFYGVDTVYGTTNPNGTASIVVSNLAVGKRYSGAIRVGDTTINNVIFYTLFDWWLSRPVQGNTMGMYNNSPAPVKAEEWNRLVDLVNSKLSKSIAKVTSGDTMDASSGGNVKVVASALGVSIESKAKVTASFFNALKNAINNK